MPTAETNPLVQIEHLYTGYNDETVLFDINLAVWKDDFIGLIGPNGGGKTTLLKTILGLLPPQKGSIRVLGKTPQQGRSQIGYVPQIAIFDSDFPISVQDVVRMGRLSPKRLFKPYNDQDDAIVQEKLAWVGMLKHKKRSLRELSGGERQRIYIARALATEPDLLLLDEPTNSVDVEAQQRIFELLNQINQHGVTILLVSHDLNAISSHVKSIACLNREMHYHGEKEITPEMLQAAYGCPVDLIAHGIPHRVLATHDKERE